MGLGGDLENKLLTARAEVEVDTDRWEMEWEVRHWWQRGSATKGNRETEKSSSWREPKAWPRCV